MVVYIVYAVDDGLDDVVESVWLDKEKAEKRSKELWRSRVERVETED